MAPRSEDFKNKLVEMFREAEKNNCHFLDVVSADLHVRVGCDPTDTDQRLPICCNVMKELMKSNDKILESPPKGMGPTLKIRYNIPR